MGAKRVAQRNTCTPQHEDMHLHQRHTTIAYSDPFKSSIFSHFQPYVSISQKPQTLQTYALESKLIPFESNIDESHEVVFPTNR